MIPIVTAVLEELKKNQKESGVTNEAYAENDVVPLEAQESSEEVTDFDNESQKSQKSFTKKEADESPRNSTENVEKNELSLVEKGMVLCVPYACSVGGTTTLTGTAPNLVLQELWQEKYPDA